MKQETRNPKVQRAIRAGTAQRKRTEKAVVVSRTKREEEERARHLADCKYWEKKLTQGNWIYKEIQKAVAAGKRELVLDGGPACALAVEEIPGLSARHREETGYLNSDEVKETWHTVTVTWPGLEEGAR